MVLRITDPEDPQIVKIIGAPAYKVITLPDRVVFFVKRRVKNRREREKQLSEFLGREVLIRNTGGLIWLYADYDNGKFVTYSEFAYKQLKKMGIIAKKVEETNITPIKQARHMTNQHVNIRGLITDKFTNGTFYQFQITDDTETTVVYLSNLLQHKFDMYEPGDYVIVSGKVNTDGSLEAKGFRKIEQPADTSRVEFVAFTKYSEMESVLDLEEYVKEAKRRGYKAIAITDQSVIHGFPAFELACKAHDIKPIYGTNITINKKDSYIVNNLKEDFRLASQRYVVFDLETTGTSPSFDQIVEIGAVKLENGQIVDTFHTFIKPTNKMSKIASEITRITDDMLKNAPTLGEVWPQFKDFIKDSVLVAHNADFDISFLKAIEPDLDITYIDTLRLSRAIRNRKRHGLAALAKEMKIANDEHHRADNDAKVLAQIFLKLLGRVCKKNIFTAQELNDYAKDLQVDRKTTSMLVYVKDKKGFKNLNKMISDAHTKYLYYKQPAIPEEKIWDYKDGLLYAAGIPGSILYDMIHQNEPKDKIMRLVEQLDFLVITPPETAEEPENTEKINKIIVELSQKMKKPLVIASGARYLTKLDRQPFQALVTSKKANKRRMQDLVAHLRYSNELYDYAVNLMGNPKAAHKTVYETPMKIVDEIINDFQIVKEELIPPGLEDSDKKLKELVKQGLLEKYGKNPHPKVLERVNYELNSIIKHGFAELYLLAHLVVKYSNDNGYVVGSRGSVGSSIVAHLIGITEVNPLPAHYVCPKCHYTEFTDAPTGYDASDKECPHCKVKMEKRGLNIPFETFVGFEGDKVPDVDLNFSDEFQSQAHEYVRKLFGEDHVVRAGTISTLANKMAYAIAKDYAERTGVSEDRVRFIASKIQGAKATTGQHPGGLLIIPKKYEIYDFTPFQHPSNDPAESYTSHFEYTYLHDNIVKLDALGHLNPTIIKYLHEFTGIDPLDVPLDDKETMKQFSGSDVDLRPLTTVDTIGIPEFGTPFVRRILETTKPTTFEELVRIAGLAHGTDVWNGNAELLIKSNEATLKEVIAARDDIMIYLIKKGLDRKHAFNIMERVRKGKGLKPGDIEEMRKHKVPEWYIESAAKIKYLFPKARLRRATMRETVW